MGPDCESEPCSCTLCGGELTVLGTLGNLTHARCRACGADSSALYDPRTEDLNDDSPQDEGDA